jgi:hypothetical protein
MSKVPNPDLVFVSYHVAGGRRRCLLSRADARKHFEALPEPYKGTYTIRPAELDDFDAPDIAADDFQNEGVHMRSTDLLSSLALD